MNDAPKMDSFRVLETIAPGSTGVGKTMGSGQAANLFNPYGGHTIEVRAIVNAFWRDGRWVIQTQNDEG